MSLSKLLRELPRSFVEKTADCAFTLHLSLLTYHKSGITRPDDTVGKNACGMTKTSPGLTFRPAADETDPRVHVFVSFPSHLHM